MKRNTIIAVLLLSTLSLFIYSCQSNSNNASPKNIAESKTEDKDKNDIIPSESSPSSIVAGQAAGQTNVSPDEGKQNTGESNTSAEISQSSQSGDSPSDTVQQTEQRTEPQQASNKPAQQQNLAKETVDLDKLKQEILSRYASQFQALKNESISRLNSLLGQAKAELDSVPKDKKTSAKLSLGFKYVQLGKSLEGEIDSRFYSLLDSMENELKTNNLPTDAVAEAKDQYNSEKSERRSYIMGKIFK